MIYWMSDEWKIGSPHCQIITIRCVKFQGAEGNELLHQFAVLTDNLVPPHRYVPHIVIDGVHDEQLQDLAQTDLLKFVCEMYSGEKPEACLVF